MVDMNDETLSMFEDRFWRRLDERLEETLRTVFEPLMNNDENSEDTSDEYYRPEEPEPEAIYISIPATTPRAVLQEFVDMAYVMSYPVEVYIVTKDRS